MLQIDVVTLFPHMLDVVTEFGVTGRARERRLYDLVAWNPRDFAVNAYRTLDDRPYGGGPGMVMMAEPLENAVGAAKQRQKSAGVDSPKAIYLSPQGSRLDHRKVLELAQAPGLVLVAGRYEGVDERGLGRVIDEELSVGDYVLCRNRAAQPALLDNLLRRLGSCKPSPQPERCQKPPAARRAQIPRQL